MIIKVSGRFETVNSQQELVKTKNGVRVCLFFQGSGYVCLYWGCGDLYSRLRGLGAAGVVEIVV